MGLVKVKNGMIFHGENRYAPGDIFEAENAENLVRIGVAEFVDEEPDEPTMTVEPETEEQPAPAPAVEATEEPDAPAMTVEQAPFKKHGKRGRKNRG